MTPTRSRALVLSLRLEAKPGDRCGDNHKPEFRRGDDQGSPMIKMDKVTKVFKGDVVALRDVTIDIGKGEFVFLVGPSGSGKSTFIRLLNREEVPEHGRIFVAGRDIGGLSAWRVPYLRRNIGYVFQDYKLLSKKTVSENVAFALEAIGKRPQVINRQVPRSWNWWDCHARWTVSLMSCPAVSSSECPSPGLSSTGR